MKTFRQLREDLGMTGGGGTGTVVDASIAPTNTTKGVQNPDIELFKKKKDLMRRSVPNLAGTEQSA